MLDTKPNKTMRLPGSFSKNSSPTEEEHQRLVNKINFPIDNDYLDLMKNHNGAEGFVNSEIFIMLWRIEDLIAINRKCESLPEQDNYFFFGSDGSNLRYAFDKSDGSIISIDSYELGEVEPKNFGNSFKVFFDKLSEKDIE